MSKGSDSHDGGRGEGKRAKTADPAPKDKDASTPSQELPPFDERRLSFTELRSFAKQLSADALESHFTDGLATVRANAAVAAAVVGDLSPSLFRLLRDSDSRVAQAAAETLERLKGRLAEHVPLIVKNLDGAGEEVLDAVVGTLASMVGSAGESLAAALDVEESLAIRTVIAACQRAETAGIDLLLRASKNSVNRVRVNAVAGLSRLTWKADVDRVVDRLTEMTEADAIPDLRQGARLAIQSILQRVAEQGDELIDELPKNIPDFEERALSASELAEYAAAATAKQIVAALEDGRKHLRINGARLLMAKGSAESDTAAALGLLLSDSVTQVRRAAALTFGKLGDGAVLAAEALVAACGDVEEDIADSAADALRSQGSKVEAALIAGLDAGEEAHGHRIAKLASQLPGAAELLCTAFGGPAVNVQVNAARGLSYLGAKRSGGGIKLLEGARTGGDIRTRDAVALALEILNPRKAGPPPVKLKGFEDGYMSAADLSKSAPSLRIDSLLVALNDGSSIVRANSATALEVLGEKAVEATALLAARVQDDTAKVRIAALRAIGAMGKAALEVADAVVLALGDVEDSVVAAANSVVKSTGPRFISALVKGLETDDRRHAENILAIIGGYPDALDILCDAFESAAVNVQVNAAIGLGLLGRDRVGRGIKLLEGARTGGWVQTRDAVFEALEMLAPPDQGPPPIRVPGFEDKLLGADAFDASKLNLDSLLVALNDGREMVRANAATALGILGQGGDALPLLGVRLRDEAKSVRLATAEAIGKIVDATVELAKELVGALGDREPDVIGALSKTLAAKRTKVIGALVRGLETDDEDHADNILTLLLELPDALDILCDAFESAAVNVQVNAARGLGRLGAKRVGRGRKALEGARTGGDVRTREAVFKALAMLDG